MTFTLIRLFDNGVDTIGMLSFRDSNNETVYVWTLEDTYREKKIAGQTRIPAGTYKISLKKSGRIYDAYIKHNNVKIRQFTEKYGVLEFENVPGYEGVLIHIGNNSSSTSGCVLCGNGVNNNSMDVGYISESTLAYDNILSAVEAALMKGDDLAIKVLDYDKILKGDLLL